MGTIDLSTLQGIWKRARFGCAKRQLFLRASPLNFPFIYQGNCFIYAEYTWRSSLIDTRLVTPSMNHVPRVPHESPLFQWTVRVTRESRIRELRFCKFAKLNESVSLKRRSNECDSATVFAFFSINSPLIARKLTRFD